MTTRRHSTLRAEILRLLKDHHLLSAPEIVEGLLPTRPVNKTSVYRALEILKEQGLINQQSLLESESKYELSQDHHDHLVCLNCGRVESIECAIQLPETKSFAPKFHHLTIYGTCRDCSQEEIHLKKVGPSA